MQLVQAYFSGINRAGPEVYHSSAPSTDAKNEWNCMFSPHTP